VALDVGGRNALRVGIAGNDADLLPVTLFGVGEPSSLDTIPNVLISMA
jgi:hypothetical protein